MTTIIHIAVSIGWMTVYKIAKLTIYSKVFLNYIIIYKQLATEHPLVLLFVFRIDNWLVSMSCIKFTLSRGC